MKNHSLFSRAWHAAFGVWAWMAGILALAGELQIQPAVQLNFTTVPGRVYQLQQTDDLGVWDSPGGYFVAAETRSSRFESAADADSRAYRLVESPSRPVTHLLEPIRSKYKLPALAVVVVRSNRVVGLGMVGQRKWTVNEPVTLPDRWHQGSITKSMTATLAARLVQEGVVQWTTTLGEVFPDKAAAMQAAWRSVTLEQLLSHRGGAPDAEWMGQQGVWGRLWDFGGTPRESRIFLLDQVTSKAPQSPPGTQYIYSNAGYALAGALLEQRTGVAWEDLITQKLFRPLGMASAGFGVPATPRHIDQPWGHTFANGTPSPVAPGTEADNPPAIGPAGTVHCSALDLATYLTFHLAGARGTGGLLLTPAVFAKLYADPDGDGYALGWNVGTRPWAGGRTINHTGSNNQWYTNVWLAPGKEWGCLVLTNIGGNTAFQATDDVVGAMIREFL